MSDVNIENVRRLQSLVDKNSTKIPEGDYLALCDITKKLYEREEEMTIITWMVCLRQAEQAMQCCASRPGFDPANNPKHEARWRKYEKRRRKYARRLDDAGYDVPVYVEYDMEEKQLKVAYPDYSDDSDDSDDDDSDDDEEVPTNDPVADDDSDDDEEVPTDDPVAGGEFQDGSLEHPVDLTVEDEDVTKSGFVLKFLGTEIFRIQ